MSPPSDREFPVTLWDVYLAVEAVDRRVLVVEETIKAQAADRSDHEARIRTLEKLWYGVPVSGVAAIAAIVLRFIK